MADRGIIFAAPMVRALLAGRKTQTRRLLTLRGHRRFSNFGPSDTPGYNWHFRRQDGCWCDHRAADLPLPYAIGDRLYVREGLAWNRGGDDRFFYRADNSDIPETIIPAGFQITNTHAPGMHMPRWASRLWLSVTDVRVQRLQDISGADCIAEGSEPADMGTDEMLSNAHRIDLSGMLSHQLGYRRLWDSLHTKPGERWDDNPWVCAVSFDVHHGNIDQVQGGV